MADSKFDQIARILLRHTDDRRRSGEISSETALIDGGLDLSSIALLEALIEVENELGFRVRDEDLTAEALSSVGKFVEHLCRQVGE